MRPVGAVNDAASRIAADDQDFAPLIAMFDRAITPLKGSRPVGRPARRRVSTSVPPAILGLGRRDSARDAFGHG